MKRSTLWWVLFFVPLGVLLFASLVAMYAIGQARERYERMKAELALRGEILDIAQFAPVNPKAEKKTRLLLSACKELEREFKNQNIPQLKVWRTLNERGELISIHKLEKPPLPADAEAELDWKSVEAAYEGVAPQMARVRELLKEPEIDMPLELTPAGYPKMGGAQDLYAAVDPIAADGYLNLRKQNIDGVIDDIEALLSIFRSMRTRAFVTKSLLSAGILERAFNLTWTLLNAKICAINDLQRLSAIWEQTECLRSIATNLKIERASSLPIFEQNASEASFSLIEDEAFASSFLERMPSSIQFLLWQNLLRYDDGIASLAEYQHLIDAASQSQSSNEWNRLLSATERAEALRKPLCPISNTLVPVIINIPHALVLSQVLADLTVAAIALEQYALAHGGYPESLEALSPDITKITPLDPIDNKPFRYRKNADGSYLLYSIGKNGIDDRGDAPSTERSVFRRPDMVWPLPATAPDNTAERPRIVPKKFVRRIAAPTPTPAQRVPQNTP